MTFGPPNTEAKGARITSIDTFNQCLDYMQKEGYNEVDTARAYIAGDQEAWSKEAGWQKRGLKLATKAFPTEPGKHKPDVLKGTFNKSLRELGTDCVDIFYLHAPDRSVPFEETLKACDDLFKEGKFVELGLSNYAAWEVAEIWNIANERKWVKPTIYQAMYNAITRDIETELVPCCRKYGLDIVVYNPVSRISLCIQGLWLMLTCDSSLEASSPASTKRQKSPLKDATRLPWIVRARCTATATSRMPHSKHYARSSRSCRNTT